MRKYPNSQKKKTDKKKDDEGFIEVTVKRKGRSLLKEMLTTHRKKTEEPEQLHQRSKESTRSIQTYRIRS